MKLNTDELLEIKGGAKSGLGAVIILTLGGLITVIAGIFDGITNPSKCNVNK